MRTRRIVIVIALVVIIALGVFGWTQFNPGPMAFAGGSTVALADYHAANPTGVPADLANADIIKRGEYLARAADCLVCHTAPGGEDYAGGLEFPLPFGTLYSPISLPTRRPASEITATGISSTRCRREFCRTARVFIRPCRFLPTLT